MSEIQNVTTPDFVEWITRLKAKTRSRRFCNRCVNQKQRQSSGMGFAVFFV